MLTKNTASRKSTEFTQEEKDEVRRVVLSEQSASHTTVQPKLSKELKTRALIRIFHELESEGVLSKGGRGKMRQVLLRPDGTAKAPEELVEMPQKKPRRKTAGRQRRRPEVIAPKPATGHTTAIIVAVLEELAGHYGGEREKILQSAIVRVRGGDKSAELEDRLERIAKIATKR